MKNSVNSSLAHRQAVCNLPGGYSTILPHKGVHCSNWFLSDDHMCLTSSWHVTSMTKITIPSENCSTWHRLSPIHILHSTVNVGSTNNFCRQKLDYCALSLFGGIHGTIVNCYLASVSVNNTLPLSSVYQISPDITAIYRRNRKFLPLGITAPQPQSQVHLGTPYTTTYFTILLAVEIPIR